MSIWSNGWPSGERFYNFDRPHGAFAGQPGTKNSENGYSNDGDCPTRSVTSHDHPSAELGWHGDDLLRFHG